MALQLTLSESLPHAPMAALRQLRSLSGSRASDWFLIAPHSAYARGGNDKSILSVHCNAGPGRPGCTDKAAAGHGTG